MTAASAADVVNSGTPQSVLPAPGTKTSSDGSTDDHEQDDADAASSDAAAVVPGQAQAAASPSQPIAAAVSVNGALNFATTTANGSALGNVATAPTNGAASGVAIDQPAKARARVSSPIAIDQAPDTDSTQTTAAKQGAPANIATGPNQSRSGSPSNTDSAQTSSSSPQQAPAPPDTDGITSVPTDPSITADSNRAVARPGGPIAASSADSAGLSHGQTAAGTATTSNAVPNFGFSAANSLSPPAITATSASPGGTAAAAVPVAGLAVAIAARALAGSHQFDIRLDPPELGRIDVRLDVDRNGQTTTHVTADRADTLQLLQSQQPQLERALEQAGLKTADNGLQFTLRDQSFAGQNGSGSGDRQNVARLVIPDSELKPVDATQIYSRLRLAGGVDIRV